MQPLPLSSEGQLLSKNLHSAAAVPSHKSDETVHVAGVGAGLYAAYEKLRNATEYIEQHLLLRSAIERFLRRNILFRGSSRKLGHEIIVELTEAGYLKNDSISVETVVLIDGFIVQYVNLAKTIEHNHKVPHDKAKTWTLQVLSVCIENLVAPHRAVDGFIDFAYQHYLNAIDRHPYGNLTDEEFENSVYCAVQRVLFKSDIATVRYGMMARLSEKDKTTVNFVAICAKTDELFQGSDTNRLVRLVGRNGAPFRVLQEAVIPSEAKTGTHAANSLATRDSFLAKVRGTTEKLYDQTHSRLVKGVIRAITFIFITKMAIGLAIEVPYDILMIGGIAILPLVVNLMFPPLYMATAIWGISKPGKHNTEEILSRIDRIVYQTDKPSLRYSQKQRVDSRGLRTVFNVVYGLAFIISFGLAVLVLRELEFTIVHGLVFFVFFSAVSFLRFRLIQSARELEVVDHRQSLASTIADFFYTPFIRLGMWLSDQYKQVNIISVLLDFAIEMPLKTTLRLIRQWAGFMRDKREEL
ncbi:MAG: hypothetical protein PVI21_05870 [Candidatus Woesebacteria bacterium]|jgi:hypothetical protein